MANSKDARVGLLRLAEQVLAEKQVRQAERRELAHVIGLLRPRPGRVDFAHGSRFAAQVRVVAGADGSHEVIVSPRPYDERWSSVRNLELELTVNAEAAEEALVGGGPGEAHVETKLGREYYASDGCPVSALLGETEAGGASLTLRTLEPGLSGARVRYRLGGEPGEVRLAPGALRGEWSATVELRMSYREALEQALEIDLVPEATR